MVLACLDFFGREGKLMQEKATLEIRDDPTI